MPNESGAQHDALIQPYSGHATRQSLEIYSRIALADAQHAYNEAITSYPVQTENSFAAGDTFLTTPPVPCQPVRRKTATLCASRVVALPASTPSPSLTASAVSMVRSQRVPHAFSGMVNVSGS